MELLEKSHSSQSKIERKNCNLPSNTCIGPLKIGPGFSGVTKWFRRKDIQGVHKVFRQFKKFITKAVDKISYIDLFYINQCLLKFLVKLKFCVSD